MIEKTVYCLFIFVSIIIILYLILLVLRYIATYVSGYKIFIKAGEKGWKSLIPFYRWYVYFKIIGISPYLLLSFLILLLPIITRKDEEISILLGSCIFIFIYYFRVYFCAKLANSFKKNFEFVEGLYYLGSVFYMILAFDKSEYVGEYSNKNSKISE